MRATDCSGVGLAYMREHLPEAPHSPDKRAGRWSGLPFDCSRVARPHDETRVVESCFGAWLLRPWASVLEDIFLRMVSLVVSLT